MGACSILYGKCVGSLLYIIVRIVDTQAGGRIFWTLPVTIGSTCVEMRRTWQMVFVGSGNFPWVF